MLVLNREGRNKDIKKAYMDIQYHERVTLQHANNVWDSWCVNMHQWEDQQIREIWVQGYKKT